MNLNIKQRLTKWATERPKQNIWYYLFWCFFLSKTGVSFVVLSVMLSAGLLTPMYSEKQTDEVFNNATIILQNNTITAYKIVYKAGQEVSRDNKLIGLFIGNYLGYLTITLFIAFLGMFFNGLLRHLVNDITEKRRKKKGGLNGLL